MHTIKGETEVLRIPNNLFLRKKKKLMLIKLTFYQLRQGYINENGLFLNDIGYIN